MLIRLDSKFGRCIARTSSALGNAGVRGAAREIIRGVVRMRAKVGALLAILGIGLAFVLAQPLAAQQGEPSGTSYITPFPEGDIYKLQSYGDAFAEGLLGGLVE